MMGFRKGWFAHARAKSESLSRQRSCYAPRRNLLARYGVSSPTGEGAIISKTTIRVLDGKTRRTVKTAQGDAYGHFELNDLSPGRYAIALSSGGFSPELVEVDTTQAVAGTFRTIRLHARDCDAPNENCDTFSDKPIPDTHPIVDRTAP